MEEKREAIALEPGILKVLSLAHGYDEFKSPVC